MGLLYGPPFGVSILVFCARLGIDSPYPQLLGIVLILTRFMGSDADHVLVLRGQREGRCVSLRHSV